MFTCLMDAAPMPGPSCATPTEIALALEARGLTIVRGRRVIIRGVHLAAAAGEMVALRGANGAGKSTLLHCLAGALRPSDGEVLWFGEFAARTSETRRRIGFLGHESGVYLTLTSRENLMFAGRMFGIKDVAARVDRLLAAAGLAPQGDMQAGRLSRGQRQRLAIARAVLHEPRILLLDEPFTSLDAHGSDWLRDLLQHRRANGCAIVVACHDVDLLAFDRVMALDGGRP